MNQPRYVPIFLLCALFLSTSLEAASVVRGPYLQMQTETGITVRWRTDVATDSVVRYGLSPGSLGSTVTVGGSRTEHSVRVDGLSAGQQYYYSVGDSIETLAGDASHHFHAAPVQGAAADTRIWVLGDSGTANGNAMAVRDAYVAWAGAEPADIWLMLGDNAYNNGTDAEYQAAVFDIYPEMLRQMPLWSTLGNHDGYSADSGTQTGPYYEIFDLPSGGEIGGWPSGTEAYYSFDYANIHFVCLDSYDSNRAVGSPMLQWLQADLADNTQPWVIAFWHHPPYTKGSHDSDTEGALIDMRQNALPILESWGVDLVMTGHSHSYERSYLLDGHYGASGTFSLAAHALDSGDGRESGDGAYEKPDLLAAENAGAVYAVAGSSGKISGGSLNHPAMFLSLNSLGSLVLDVAGNRLDAVFLDQTGAVRDSFTIVKTPDTQPPLLNGASAEDASHVQVSFSEAVDGATASEPANYAIGGLSVLGAELLPDGRSVRLATGTMTDATTYTLTVSNVKDLAGNVIAANSTVDFDYFETVEISFQDGIAPSPTYAGTRDTYIREYTPTTNYGAAASLQVDGDDPGGSGNDMNILLAWDTSAIPAGATVMAAELVLEVTNISSGPYHCYGLERAWVEAEATWNQAAAGSAWGTPGAEAAADRDPTALCSFGAGSTGPLVIPLNADGLARLQAWVDDPAGNHGLVISNTSPSDGADFHSRESASALARPRLDVIYHVGAPPPNAAPGAAFAADCVDLDCAFTDASTDADGSVVAWSWDFGDGAVSSDTDPSHAYVASGTYAVTLTVTDDDGDSDSVTNNVTVTEPPAFIDQFALADVATSGSGTGSYLDTHMDDGTAQALTERESGGKKNQRYSYLEHTWQFSVAAGSTVTLAANAWSGGTADGDGFRFEWSTDNASFTPLFEVNSTDPGNVQSGVLAGAGTIYVRVVDTDRVAGNKSLDTVFVDHLYIRSENGAPPPNQAPVVNFSSSCTGTACSFTDTSSDPDGMIVGWDWSFGDGGVSPQQHPSHDYGAPGTYTVTLTVTDDDGATGSSSREVTVSAGSSIGLTVTGYKDKGRNTANLAWSGASGVTVRVFRDGGLVATTDNDGAYTDATGDKGSRSYTYQVCEAAPSTACSDEVTLAF